MDDQQKLRTLFPRASRSFFEANETQTHAKLSHSNPQPNKAPTLDAAIPRKKESAGRVEVRYRLRRVRPLDPDNACGSTKDLTDALCCCGLIPGDNPFQITLIVEQKQVQHYSDEGTDIYLTWPEVKT